MKYKLTDFIAIWTLIGISLIMTLIPSSENATLNLGIFIIAVSSISTLGVFALLWFNDSPRTTCMLIIYLELTNISATASALFASLDWNILVAFSAVLFSILLVYTFYLPHKQ